MTGTPSIFLRNNLTNEHYVNTQIYTRHEIEQEIMRRFRVVRSEISKPSVDQATDVRSANLLKWLDMWRSNRVRLILSEMKGARPA